MRSPNRDAGVQSMSLPIEDYALIGDCQTAALVARNGSIDWFCVPRFDSAACFAALLGDESHGRWRIAPRDSGAVATRTYNDHTLILETTFETAEGRVRIVDFMPPRGDGVSHIVRIVVGLAGRVAMRSETSVRFNYGATTPWVTRLPDGGHGVRAIAGPSMIVLRAPFELVGEAMQTVGEFAVAAGERVAFVLTHVASHLPLPAPLDAERALEDTVAYWTKWGERQVEAGPYTDIVRRSLMVLKALTFGATGRHRRGPHHVAARADRRRAQLGLPLLLAARRDADAVRADERGVLRRGERVADVARTRGGR